MITKRESILKNGMQFKFKTAPFDPYDAFRGRYVALQIEENYVLTPKEIELKSDQTVYALIDTDDKGFAKFTNVTINKPLSGSYIQTKVHYISGEKTYLDLPLDRYYMEEKSAPLAEKLYQRHSQHDKQDACVTVRVKNGFMVIENLYVGGQRIEDAVRQERKN
jgi:uncharacterized membrane-anchored protein